MYEIKKLEGTAFSQITECINEAFSDYCVPFHVSEKELSERFERENVRYDLSYGAFCQEKLVAVLLNAIGCYQGEMIAFDAVTGVIPGHRRKGVYTQMLRYCREDFKREKIGRYVLEVIQTNDSAVETYQKMGLHIAKEYACFQGRADSRSKELEYGNDIPAGLFPLESLEKLYLFAPSFENRTEMIKKFADQYHVLYSGEKEHCSAFVIYHAETGQVKQLGRKAGHIAGLCQLLCYLSSRFENIKIHNIVVQDNELVKSLEDMGFHHFCDQYEMEMVL